MQKSAIPLATFQVFSYLGSRGSQWVKGGVRGVPGGKRDDYGVQGGRQALNDIQKIILFCPTMTFGQNKNGIAMFHPE